MSEQESIARERLSQLAKEISWVEKKIPEVREEYEEKKKELYNCMDKKRLNMLRIYVKETRLYLKQLELARGKLIKEAMFLLKQIEGNEGKDNYV